MLFGRALKAWMTVRIFEYLMIRISTIRIDPNLILPDTQEFRDITDLRVRFNGFEIRILRVQNLDFIRNRDSVLMDPRFSNSIEYLLN